MAGLPCHWKVDRMEKTASSGYLPSLPEAEERSNVSPNDYVALVLSCNHRGSQGSASHGGRDGGMHERINSETSMEDGRDEQLCSFTEASVSCYLQSSTQVKTATAGNKAIQSSPASCGGLLSGYCSISQ